MRLARSIPTTLALALVTLALSAQAPTVPADTSLDRAVPVAAISQAVGAGHTDGMTWAAGPDYKAFFAAGTAEFIPALGKRAPHNFPVRFTTESIRRGGTSAFEAEATTRRSGPQVAGNTVWFDLGNGIVERYEARAEHLKQSFVFASPPAGDGDLVVRMRLDTELTAESGTDLGGLQLTSDYGGVEIGAVVGIDANGQHGSGTMHFDGTYLELVLADDFVRTAAYPLELDPTVGTLFPIGNLPSNDFDPEVAYGSIPDQYLVVWENTFSASQCKDGKCRRCSSTGKHRKCRQEQNGPYECQTCWVKGGCGSAEKIDASVCSDKDDCPAINTGNWVADTSGSAVKCNRSQCWKHGNSKPTGC